MQPDFDLRLRAMSKAMEEVVLPAIDPNNDVAIEQARLVLGSLALLREQVDYAHWYEVADSRLLGALAKDLVAAWPASIKQDIDAALANVEQVAARWDIPLSTLRDAKCALREAICSGLEEALTSNEQAVPHKLERIVIEHSFRQVRLERAFVAKSGFDVSPQSLIPIADALREVSA